MDRELNPQGTQIVLYASPDGQVKVDVFLQNETVWLTQKKIADLFDVEVNTINYHVKEIFKSGELIEGATIRKFRIVQKEGLREVEREADFYNLDMIIAVGYRVNSYQATQFRVWATRVLREYIIKGFALDDERLKSGKSLRKDYFDELLERIRDIRASERLFYQKIADIYAQCSADYDSNADITKVFYATVQNKLHWAIHGYTAAELIAGRVSALKPYMGLTTWKGAPKGKIRRIDVSIAKNYLSENELRQLNRIVTMYLDYAEMQAEKQRTMTMKDWITKLDAFLKFNERDVLTDPGKVSAEVARELAEKEFEKYEEKVRKVEASQPVSDFDKLVEKTRFLQKKSRKKKK
ncbi:MAG: virulence RhuM family protein [Candidatus Omnitrophota bacterium]|nr:virulence RhuM family protein [Candidatus Omnitrophota bacterium]